MYYRADLFPILPQGSVYKDVDEVFYWKAAVKLFFLFYFSCCMVWDVREVRISTNIDKSGSVGICIGICGYETSLNARRHLALS